MLLSKILGSAAIVLTAACGILYYFYDVMLKSIVDNYLTEVFRKSGYEADEKAGRTVYKSPDYSGFNGMMKEMCALFSKHKNDTQYIYAVFRDAMDLFFAKLGVPPDDYAAFNKANPKLARWINKATANVTFSWVVGGAKIEHAKGNIVKITVCHFRERIGEEGCVQMCQKPVEKYFTERMHTPILLAPQPRDQGVGCKICYGECLPEELQW